MILWRMLVVYDRLAYKFIPNFTSMLMHILMFMVERVQAMITKTGICGGLL